MLKVGLTGGIASGKSTISEQFSKLGIAVIDTDIISHELMQKGEEGYRQTLSHFGRRILNADDTINRSLLRRIVFDQPHQKQWLEKMLHPLIRNKTEKTIQRHDTDPYILVVVPLMFETGFNKLVDHVIAIDCPEAIQQRRLTQRDHINDELAQKMILAQLSNQQRLAQADSILPNRDDLSRKHDVLQLHEKFLRLAQQ